MAAYRLLNFEGFEPGALLAPHQEAVAKRSAGHACVVVSQDIRVMKITPRPPARKGKKLSEVCFWAILAEDTNTPAGEDPIRWLLLTSKAVTTREEARRIINLYLRRWDIEVFHRVLKTGCRVESIQFKTGQALINSVMIYAVIAWRILYLTHLGRQCPEFGQCLSLVAHPRMTQAHVAVAWRFPFIDCGGGAEFSQRTLPIAALHQLECRAAAWWLQSPQSPSRMEAQQLLQISALPSRAQRRRALPVPHLGHFVFTASGGFHGLRINSIRRTSTVPAVAGNRRCSCFMPPR